jgi:hypothetical protein
MKGNAMAMKIQMSIKRNSDTDEWIVRYYEDGVYNEAKTAYCDDLHDARGTMGFEADRLAKLGFEVKSRMPSSILLKADMVAMHRKLDEYALEIRAVCQACAEAQDCNSNPHRCEAIQTDMKKTFATVAAIKEQLQSMPPADVPF